MASSTLATAQKYSPISGLITDTLGNPKPGGGYGGIQFPTGATPAAAAAPATSAAGSPFASSIITGKYTPDWKSLIEGDSGLLGAKALLNAGAVSDQASRDAAIQSAYEQFGQAPGSTLDLAGIASKLGMTQADLQNILSPDVQKLAQDATDAGLSTEYRLGKANTDAIRQIRNAINARGLNHSTELNYQLGNQNDSFRQAEFDARNKLLDYFQQYQAGYQSAQNQRASDLAQQYSAAADRVTQSNQGSAGGQTATLDHVDSAGRAVYRGPDGRLYGADGQPYTPPAPPSSSAPPPPAAPASAPDVYFNPRTGETSTAIPRPLPGLPYAV